MSTYFIKNEAGQAGPFTLEELRTKGISAITPILQEGTENWTTAGELEELKTMFTAPGAAVSAVPTETTVPAEATPVENQVNPVTTADATAATTVTATAPIPAPAPAPSPSPASVVAAAHKTGSAVIGWILSFAAIGGTGYYVYQDMEKNKNPTVNATTIEQSDTLATQDIAATNSPDTTTTITSEIPVSDTAAVVSTVPTATNLTTTTTTTTTKDPAALKKAEEDKKKLLAAQAKKKEEEKKKLLAEAKKKEAAAAAARETALRNNWARYVTVGSYKIEGDDKVKPFTIPVNNGYPVSLDKVTLRVDYLKKNKLVASETLVLYNIGANNSQSVQAAGNKKGHTANVYITGINSSQLHFCYPVHNGNSADPFYCK